MDVGYLQYVNEILENSEADAAPGSMYMPTWRPTSVHKRIVITPYLRLENIGLATN